MKMTDVDPSLAFGFYCRSKEEFDDFCFRVEMMHRECESPLFSVMDVKPKYTSEIVDDCASFSVDDDIDDDDDEFVMIAPVS
jgi:cysteine protease ATG4